jgi:hypothetical protein
MAWQHPQKRRGKIIPPPHRPTKKKKTGPLIM